MIVRGQTQEALLMEQLRGNCYGWSVYRYAEVMFHLDAEMGYIISSATDAFRENAQQKKLTMYVADLLPFVSNAVFRVILEREGLLQCVKKNMDLRQFKMERGTLRKLKTQYNIPTKGRNIRDIAEDYSPYLVDWAIIEVRKYHYYNLE